MTADPTLATLRERHTNEEGHKTWTSIEDYCVGCGEKWPCDAERFRQALDAALGLLRDTRHGTRHCDHRGIGLPGCWTCDPRLDNALAASLTDPGESPNDPLARERDAASSEA